MLCFKGLWPIQRSLQEHDENVGKRNPRGCIREPLIKIEAINSPPDHLHMRRAIITRLLNQVLKIKFVYYKCCVLKNISMSITKIFFQ